MNEQKNLILAGTLAIFIWLGFNYFYERPKMEALNRQAEATVQVKGESPASPPGTTLPVVKSNLPQKEALALNPRLAIKTSVLKGSINLKGCLLDDLMLLNYHETTDKSSPPITLLSPEGAKGAYFANFGWIAKESSVKLPDATSVWKTKATALTQDSPVVLEWDNGDGLKFERTITVDDKYMFTVTDKITNTKETTVSLSSFGQINRLETPEVGGFFILHEGPIGVLNGKLTELTYAKLKEKGSIEETSTGGWVGITDKYWLAALIPNQKTTEKVVFKGQTIEGQDQYQTQVLGPVLEVKPGVGVEIKHHFFAGAKILRVLDDYEAKLGFDKFDLAVDFGWFYFLTKPLFYVLEYLHNLLGNFGLAILALTVLFKVAFFPLANKSYRSMSHMKQVQPKIEALKKRFGDDKLRMNQELMDLYRKEKINPLAGCLPMLIQAPVFFCLYKVLFVTLEMRHAPFYGWIQDLSAPDPTTVFNLFGLLPFTPPSMMMIGAWPILMGVTMFLQQKLNPQPTDPAQAKAFMLMPFFLTFLLASFPAGLVIYWAWNNVLSMGQQWTIMRLEAKRVR